MCCMETWVSLNIKTWRTDRLRLFSVNFLLSIETFLDLDLAGSSSAFEHTLYIRTPYIVLSEFKLLMCISV